MKTIPFGAGIDAGAVYVGKQRPRRSLSVPLGRALGALREWRRRARSRSELLRLDDRTLRDIGITRAEALYEIDKPFWRK